MPVERFGVGLTPGPLAPPKRKAVETFGAGLMTTPLTAPPDPWRQADPSVTPEQAAGLYQADVARYQAELARMDPRQRALAETPLGILGRAGAAALPAVASGAVGALTGGLLGPAAGIAAAGLTQGATHYGLTGDVPGAINEGVLGAAFQVPGAMRGALLNARSGQALVQAKQAEQVTRLADKLKELVPAWRGYSSDAKGLSEMIGPGWNKVRGEFDAAMRAAKEAARGQTILISEQDAARLGLQPLGTATVSLSKSRVNPAQDRLEVRVDAAEAIDAVTGKSRGVTAGTYNRVVSALDLAGIGDPAAREMYREAIGFKTFAEGKGILHGETLVPEKVEAGLNRPATKGKPDVRQGPLDPALRAIKAPEMEPVEPPSLLRLGTKLAAAVGLSGATGMPHWYSHAAGSELSRALIPGGAMRYAAPPLPMGTRIGNQLNVAEGVSEGVNLGKKAAWDYILEHLGGEKFEPDPTPKPSPLQPGTPTTVETDEER